MTRAADIHVQIKIVKGSETQPELSGIGYDALIKIDQLIAGRATSISKGSSSILADLHFDESLCLQKSHLESGDERKKLVEPSAKFISQLLKAQAVLKIWVNSIVPFVSQFSRSCRNSVKSTGFFAHDSSSPVGGTSNPHPTGEGPSRTRTLKDEA